MRCSQRWYVWYDFPRGSWIRDKVVLSNKKEQSPSYCDRLFMKYVGDHTRGWTCAYLRRTCVLVLVCGCLHLPPPCLCTRSHEGVQDDLKQLGLGTNNYMFGSDHRPVLATYRLRVAQRFVMPTRTPRHVMTPLLSFFTKVWFASVLSTSRRM